MLTTTATMRRNEELLGTAMLVARLMLGAIFIGHGGQKLFAVWGGHGMVGFEKTIAGLGFPAPEIFAYMSAIAEFGGGLALVLGVLTRLGAVAIAIDMLVAIFLVHLHNGLLGGPGKPGFDFPLACLAGALVIALLGAGPYSIDGLFSWRRQLPD